MTVSSDTTVSGFDETQKWHQTDGTHVVLYTAPDSPEAAEALRHAEAIVSALSKLLEPEGDSSGERFAVYLAANRPTASASSLSIAAGKEERPELPHEARDGKRPVAVYAPSAGEPLVRAVTEHLLRQWFGPQIAAAPTFVEGISGVAAAQVGIGPSLAEVDQQARVRVAEGHSLPLAVRPHPDPTTDTSPCEGIDPLATSFLAFLIENSGAGALRRYLKAYDPDRQDQAAMEAYRHPLAVMEEEWLSRIRRKPDDGSLLRSFLHQILPLLKPYKWKQIEILVYLLLAAGYNVVQPYAIKIVIDRLTAQVRRHPGGAEAGPIFLHILGPFILLLLGINVVNGIVSLRRAYTVNWLNQNILNTLQLRMYAHLQRLGHNFYIKAKIGDIMARLSDDLDNVQSALSQLTNKALYQSFTLVGALSALFLLTRKSPTLAVPILAIIPLFAVYYAALRKRNKQASRDQRRSVGQAMADVQQHLSAHALIKAFGLEERTIADYRLRIQNLQKSKLRLALLNAMTDLSEDATTALAQLIIFGVGGYLVLKGGGRGLGVGDLSALLVLVKSIFSPIASLAGVGQTLQQATGAMERVSELFDEPVTISEKPDAVELAPLSREITLEAVSFRYGGERAALCDVSLTIPAGQHVAIVGFSGGGKSSTVNLLMRFWDPEEGSVCFDGHDLRDVTLASLRGQIGLVFQETFIFDTTLRENIALARPGATDAEIVAAARAAQLDSFIQTLPAGYDTIPGENGASLSVGQKQRIAIARVFLRNPRILILDEATSALDPKTEAGILETLAELTKGRTTISVTHRIAQAVSADRIYVLDSGKLVEQGTHDTLQNAGGLYQKLYEEASGFVTSSAVSATASPKAA